MRSLLLPLLPVLAHAFDGRVVGISDGDTLTVLDAQHQQYKIRLRGIDASEKAQPFGQKSKSNRSALAY
jgi:endonuclease YncB( thermonuclease family)